MSKELTPLQTLHKIGDVEVHISRDTIATLNLTEEYQTIEKALKRLEQLEEEKQSFDRQLEKKLKALEIIKKKKVFVAWLKHDLSTYNNTCALYNLPRLNEEEFNLLKEVGL